MAYGRVRVRDSRIGSSWTWTNYYPNLPSYTGTATFGMTVGAFDQVSDHVHPGYRKMIARGEIVAGDYERILVSRMYTNGSIQEGPVSSNGFLGNAGSTCKHTGDMIGAIEPAAQQPLARQDTLSGYMPRISQLALIKAYAKMNQSTVMSGEILAELDQTVGMLKRPLDSAQKLLRKMHLRRLRFNARTAAEILKANANTWLEYRYGWKPLIKDIEDIQKELTRKRESGLRRLVARGSEKVEGNFNSPFSLVHATAWTFDGNANRKKTVRANAGVVYECSDDSYLKSYGTRSRDVAATVWETIPYSFVVDWFVNVGPWIEAIVPNPEVRVLYSWVTTVDECIDSFEAQVKVTRSYPPVTTFYGNGGSSIQHWLTVRRTINPSLPSHPVLTTKSLGALQQADGIMLTLQQVVKGLNGFRH